MKIIVLAGGLSTERDVSLITSSKVCEALRQNGHQAAMLDVFFGYEKDASEDFFERNDAFDFESIKIQVNDPDLEAIKAERKGDPDCFFGPNVIELCKMADLVFMGLHGADGENGKVQAAFDTLGIRYTGSGYLGSALAMNKGLAKRVLQAGGVPSPKGFSLKKNQDHTPSETMIYPCVVKPCCGGSSVGVSIASDEKEYYAALEEAFRYEEEVLVEECIQGREFSIGVVGKEAMPIIEIIPKEGFYDYKNKYQSGLVDDICPAPLDEETTKKMQDFAVKAFEELKLEVYARIDFLMDEKGQMFCLEANTLPGMTPTSLLPQEALAAGISYGQLCEKMIQLTLEKYKES